MPAISYALTAVNCPALQAVGLPIWIQDGGASTPVSTRAESLAPGTALAQAGALQRDIARIDNAARYGGGCCGAILWGLGYVSDSGLSVTIGKGQAGWDSGSELKSDTPQALTDGVVNRLWLSEGGSLSVVTSASGTPLAPPDALTRWTFLMAVTCAGSVVTAVDYSGRLTQLLGNQIWRRTADAAQPGDTPPATIRFYTQTAGGIYHWDGLTYRRLSPSAPTDAQYLVLALNPELTAERRVVPGAGLVATDGGANADYTVDVNPDNATLEVASDALRVKAGGIQDSHLATPYVKADGTRAFTGDQSLGSHKLTNVTDPSAAQDAATKAYVDAVASGLDVKASCRAASTGNLTLSGTQTIDGVACIAGDRVLVKDQSTGSQNGVYAVASGAWSRATDADMNAEVTSGLFTFIEEGTVNAGTGWVLTTANPITVGSTGLSFTQFSGAGEITAGTGLTKAGNTLNVVANADGSLVANADDIQVGVLATDGQHGSRGGGSLHAGAVAAGAAGFLSGADKSKLDGVAAGAPALGLIVFGAQGALPSALTRYLAPGSGNVSINEIKVRLLVACTAQLLAVRTSAAPGTGVSDVVTVRKNGADTALTATLSDTNIEAEDTGHTVAFAAGDDLSVKLVSGTLTASQDMMVSLVLK